jgi:hypothetical protein
MKAPDLDCAGLFPDGLPPAGPPDPKQVELCREWIRLHCSPRKSINHHAYSYALKHAVESWLRNAKRPAYITNGAFIAAAIAEGYRYRRARPSSINAVFNMSLLTRRGALRRLNAAIKKAPVR